MIINLNKDDFQSKTILDINGICNSLYAGESRYGGGEIYILDSREVKGEEVVIGIDAYNQTVTGGVTKALTHIATDSDLIPLVLIVEEEDE